jgi:hypothetical protein
MEKTVKVNTKHSVSNVWLPSFWGKSSFLARPQMQKHFFLLIKNCEAGISETGDPCNKPFPPPPPLGRLTTCSFSSTSLQYLKRLERLGDLMSFVPHVSNKIWKARWSNFLKNRKSLVMQLYNTFASGPVLYLYRQIF